MEAKRRKKQEGEQVGRWLCRPPLAVVAQLSCCADMPKSLLWSAWVTSSACRSRCASPIMSPTPPASGWEARTLRPCSWWNSACSGQTSRWADNEGGRTEVRSRPGSRAHPGLPAQRQMDRKKSLSRHHGSHTHRRTAARARHDDPADRKWRANSMHWRDWIRQNISTRRPHTAHLTCAADASAAHSRGTGAVQLRILSRRPMSRGA